MPLYCAEIKTRAILKVRSVNLISLDIFFENKKKWMAVRSGKDKEYQNLTVKQADFLRAYKTRAEEKGKPPSCKEMADIAGSNQYAAVIAHTLRGKGYLPSGPSARDAEYSDLTNQRADVLRKWNAFKDGSGRDPTLAPPPAGILPTKGVQPHAKSVRLLLAPSILRRS